ncbi:hypothetical protein TNCV_2722381 [Trichonephila clavipes]|nr:hypothetical protein TNCV_2722381 [Trichonephila clavipes]
MYHEFSPLELLYFINFIEARWLRASRFHTTGPRFKLRAGQGRLSLSSLQWVDKGVPSLFGNLTLGYSHTTDHLPGTSAFAPQGPRSRILRWVQYGMILMGCCAAEKS